MSYVMRGEKAGNSEGPGSEHAKLDVVEEVQDNLSAHPRFADTVRLQHAADRRYEFIAELLSAHLSPAASAAAKLLASGSTLVWRDPVIRKALEEGLYCLADKSAGASGVAETLGLAAEPVLKSPELMPCEYEEAGRLRAGPDKLIWLPGRPAGTSRLLRHLQELMNEVIRTNDLQDAKLHRPEPDHAEAIDRGAQLLTAILPRLGRGVLDHVVAISLLSGRSAEGRQLSAAGGLIAPGIVFMDPVLLSSAWTTAATLLHEGLHLRAFDIERSAILVAAPDRWVEIPWRKNPWHVSRVLFSFHVYVHLALFEAAAGVRAGEFAAQFGTPPESVTAIGRARDDGPGDTLARTRFLGELLTGPLASALTADGRRFVNWLIESSQPLVGWRPVAAEPPETPRPSRTERTASSHPVGDSSGDSSGEPQYAPAADAAVKSVPELAMAYAYSPSTRRLSFLNVAAWVVFELCDGQPGLASAYRELVGGKMSAREADKQLRQAVALLTAEGLIEEVKGGES
jgi:hypothetical protein